MYSKEFRKLLRPNRLLLPKQPNHDGFLYVIRKVFQLSSICGVYGSRNYINLLWTAVIFGSLFVIEVMAIWKVIKALAGLARDISGNRSVTARLSGTIFYSISIISLILSSKLCYSWRNLSEIWAKVERSVGVNIPADKTLRRRMFFIAGAMAFFCLFEHSLSILSSVGLDCPTSLILKRYVIVSHGFIFMGQDYSEWFAPPLVIINTIAGFLWNFLDLLIVLISMGLTSRYHRLNQCLAKICLLEKKQMQSDKRTETVKAYTWRKLREAYVKQAMLVRLMDDALGGIIVFSCSCNFYFICLQLFLVITQGQSSTLVTGIYFVASLLWLCVRVCCVVLAAADVNVHSRVALKYIYTYETHGYNVEVDRLQDQLTKDYIALSGMGFFYLNKTILLQMAGAIITYELVLIQFDDQGNDGLQVNITKYLVVYDLDTYVVVADSKTVNILKRDAKYFMVAYNMKLNSLQTSYEKKPDHFLPTVNSIFSKARIFGISGYGVTISFFWSMLLLLILLIVETRAVYRVLRLLTGYARADDGLGLTSHLAGSMFYGNALFSLFFSIQFMQSWKKLSLLWLRMETTNGLNFSPDTWVKKKAIFISTSVLVLAFLEHFMSIMSKLDFSCSAEELLKRLTLNSHGFLIGEIDYNFSVGLSIFILSKFATALWNFQDLLIILISMGLTSRYQRLNLYVTDAIALEKHKGGLQRFGTDLFLHIQLWRRLREAYVRQAALVRLVDKNLGGLILLSNINNLFFICLQLFNGIHKDKSGALNRGYYLFSVGFLIMRACGVVLAASDVHRHSMKAVTCLNNCPSYSYNIEIKRLHYQLTHDFVALTGMGFFSLRREVLLQVAATILKYELVLIQYDS